MLFKNKFGRNPSTSICSFTSFLRYPRGSKFVRPPNGKWVRLRRVNLSVQKFSQFGLAVHSSHRDFELLLGWGTNYSKGMKLLYSFSSSFLWFDDINMRATMDTSGFHWLSKYMYLLSWKTQRSSGSLKSNSCHARRVGVQGLPLFFAATTPP